MRSLYTMNKALQDHDDALSNYYNHFPINDVVTINIDLDDNVEFYELRATVRIVESELSDIDIVSLIRLEENGDEIDVVWSSSEAKNVLDKYSYEILESAINDLD